MLGPEDQLRKPGSCGRAVLNVETRVVDDAMRDVRAGRGRRDRAPLAAAAARATSTTTSAPRPRSRAAGSTRGDLATIDDEGYITVVDRKKDMIKTGGENVASREVEETIYRLPQVSEVAVIGLPHPRWVEAVTAVVVVKAGQELDEAAGARALPRAPGALQGAQARGLRRALAEEPERQAAQARAAARACGAVRRGLSARRFVAAHGIAATPAASMSVSPPPLAKAPQ